MSHTTSYAAVYETAAEPVFRESSVQESVAHAAPRPRSQGGVLLASLAGALVTTCLSGASLYYAFTHIPEVDPAAEAAPVAAVASIAAESPSTPAKLDVLTPPVYGREMISEAPAAPFVPLNARVKVSTDDMNALAQADVAQADEVQPCADPCSAHAGYVAHADAEPPAPIPASSIPTYDASRHANTDMDDDGNAPPPPDMTVN